MESKLSAKQTDNVAKTLSNAAAPAESVEEDKSASTIVSASYEGDDGR